MQNSEVTPTQLHAVSGRHASWRRQTQGRSPLGLGCFLVCVALWPVALAEAAAPTLTRLFPAGGQRGTTVIVECSGKFKWPAKIWAPGVKAVALKDSGKIELTIPGDVPVDRVWIRLYDAEGVSPALPFLLSNLPEFVEKESNNRLDNAQPIPSAKTTTDKSSRNAEKADEAKSGKMRPGSQGVANGVLQSSGDVDGYAIHVEAGTTLVADMAANARLNSPVDAVLQVVTPTGFVVAENHDAVGLDPRVIFTARKTGTYVVRAFGFPSKPNSTIGFSGANTYVYRLTMTTGPFIANGTPVSVKTGAATIPVFGWNIPEGARLKVQGGVDGLKEVESSFDKQIPGSSEVGYIHQPGFAGQARIRRLPFKSSGVVRPGGGPGVAVVPPAAVTGCLDTSGHVTRHVFHFKKGTSYALSAESSTFDLPSVPLMRIIAPDGKQAAVTKDPGSGKETRLKFAAKVDGPHEIQVFDRYRHHGAGHFYQVTVVPDETDYELSVGADSLLVTPAKPLDVAVTVARRNAGGRTLGPITISIEGLPKGLTAAPVVSPANGDASKKVTLKISSDGTAFSGPIRIVGKCTEPAEIQRIARTPVKLGNAFDTIWLTGTAKKK